MNLRLWAASTVLCWLFCAGTQADGRLMLGRRELLRVGDQDRQYCKQADEECPNVLLRTLSGYNYGRSHVGLGAARTFSGGSDDRTASAEVSPALLYALSLASADLPAGRMEVGTVDFALLTRKSRSLQLGATLVRGESLFFCRDRHTRTWHLPIAGMATQACEPDAILGIDLSALHAQWQPGNEQLALEWLRVGPAFELLANGNGFAHLLRSLSLSPQIDLRSTTPADSAYGPIASTVGARLRLSARVRSPQWEARLSAHYRLALGARLNGREPHQLWGELALVRNFFINDRAAGQFGLQVLLQHAGSAGGRLFVLPQGSARTLLYSGVTFTWIHEPPAI